MLDSIPHTEFPKDKNDNLKRLVSDEYQIKHFFINNENSSLKSFYTPMREIFDALTSMKPFIDADSIPMQKYQSAIFHLYDSLKGDKYCNLDFVNTNGKNIVQDFYNTFLNIRSDIIRSEYEKINSQSKQTPHMSIHNIDLPSLPDIQEISTFKKTSRYTVFTKNIAHHFTQKMLTIIDETNWIKTIIWGSILIALAYFAFNIFSAIRQSNQVEDMSEILMGSHATFSAKQFSKDDFLKLIILIEKKNQEVLKDKKWDIRYNKDKQVIIFKTNNLSERSCQNFVANKEISYDAAYMTVNNIALPVNYWTASVSPNWTQKVNQNLCMTNNNEILISIDANFANRAYRRTVDFKNTELQFLINQHKIAKYFNNSTLIDESLTRRIMQLESFKK